MFMVKGGVVHVVIGHGHGINEFQVQSDGHSVVLLKNQRKHFII
jgi:hypothetical protein